MDPLLKMAADEFGALTPAEVKLLKTITSGGLADCRYPVSDQNDPEEGSSWPQDRTIRSSIFRWLCTNKDASLLINSIGFGAQYARLVGQLNLECIALPFSFTLFKCAVPDGINLRGARLGNLNLNGTVCSYLMAEQLCVNGSVSLREKFKATGPVIFVRSTISGDFRCDQARLDLTPSSIEAVKSFEPPANAVLLLDLASIGGRLVLNDVKAAGVIQLVRASIRGGFHCNAAEIAVGINMRDAQSRSMTFKGTQCPYLIAEDVDVRGSVFLGERFSSNGTVVLLNATINGDLDCGGSSFGTSSPDPEVKKKAEESFGKNLPEAALVLDGSTIRGNLILGYGFEAQREVSSNSVSIGASLVCDSGRFLNAGRETLVCQFTQVRNAALFRRASDESPPFSTDGVVDFFGTNISGSLDFTYAEFLRSDRSGVVLQNATIGGMLQWQEIRLTPATQLSLYQSKVGQLSDDEGSWPTAGNLVLDGFSYDAIAGIPSKSRERKLWVNSRLKYLRLQGNDRFTLQPHRKLAEILRKSGYEDNANDVLIDMHKSTREQGGFSLLRWLWSWIIQWTIGFGYRSHRAFVWASLFVLIGALIFRTGYRAGYFVPVKQEGQAVHFSSIGYSLDAFLPIINLHQEDLWMPADRGRGILVQIYYWIHICLGWALITLGVAGFTGLIRKE
jgi:hypothetical protein